MKVIRLYTNKPEIFQPIHFNEGLSAIVAEIRLPENHSKTVHNLGKSTVARLVDFCLLKGKSQHFLLFRHQNLFGDFVFYLEVQLDDGSFLTVSRVVDSKKPVSILSSMQDIPDATQVDPAEWNHVGLPFAAAKRLLEGHLGSASLTPYDYRDLLGYVLREQNDYGDVFHLGKFKGKHREWKPFLAKLLGLNADLTSQLYDCVDEEARVSERIEHLRREAGTPEEGAVVRIDGIIGIKSRELSQLTQALDSFDFSEADSRANQVLVEQVENELARLNEESYHLSQLLSRLDDSLRGDAILFDPEEASALFREVGVAFEGQLKRDFQQLIRFNRAISQERRQYLLQEKDEAAARLQQIRPMLDDLQAKRSELFNFLEGSETIKKYQAISRQVIDLQADISSLTRQKEALEQATQLRQEKREIQERKNHLQTAIERDVLAAAQDPLSRYMKIQQYFDEIVHAVLDEHALLSVSVIEQTGSLAFSAEIVNESGNATSAGQGFTYGKLLCIAFDLAVLRAYLAEPFPRFSFHDGVFESLETRAKRRLLAVLRLYADYGLQPVITTLDSDLPDPIDSSDQALASDEVVRCLHDDGSGGRLFNLDPF